MLRALTAAVTVFLAVLMVPGPAAAESSGPKVLVFTKSTEQKNAHRSTPEAVGLLEMNARRYGFDVTTTDDASVFTDGTLDDIDVVMWLNTYGNVLNGKQQDAFKTWMNDGGGFVGVHGAARTEREWDYYHDLIGAFESDGEGAPLAERDVSIDDRATAGKHAPSEMTEHNDQWYTFDRDPGELDDMQIVATASTGDDDEDGTPVGWAREFQGGRSWYTGLGHAAKSYEDGDFMTLLRSGIWWAADAPRKPMVSTQDAAPGWPYGVSFLAWIAAVAAGGAVAVVRLNRREALP